MTEGISRPPTMPGRAASVSPEVDVMDKRAIAAVIDGVAITVFYFIVYAIFFVPLLLIQNETLALVLILLATLAPVVVAVAYYPVLEGFWGTTLGKRLCGIKVIREDDGGVPGLGAAFVRNLLRVVDGFPALYLVGYLVAKDDPKKRRLGDKVAHTIVVRK